jgi:asparagine synthase (glutamine-hydrolysing)
MCGIAGYFLRNGAAERGVVQSMCDVIRHRGPDDEGFHVDGGCAIGMRRLSIIDLSTGHQPISNEDGSVWIVFNGEIYEYQELREWLIERGHRFRTRTDTECILHLYEESGAEGIAKLRGMFAFCIWDAKRRKILLARDRFGKKPLYYAARPDGIWFGSELKCLRAAGLPMEPDREALKLYFQFTFIPDPFSAFEGVRKLAPGTWLEYDENGNTRTGRYWRLPAPAEKPVSGQTRQQAMRQIRDLFDESVRIRMIADVPLGAFLSGGIDSSSVVASMALQSKAPVKTFSIGFEEAAYNELAYAAMVAKKYRTEHHEIIVKPDSVALVEKLIEHFDEPFADSSAIPTYIVSEFAARHVKVALSGDGGDELFAGYDSFQIVQRLRLWDALPQVARGALAMLANALPYSAFGKNYLHMISRPDPVSRYLESNFAPRLMRNRLLRPAWMLPADPKWIRTQLSDCFLPNGADDLAQALYFEATAKLSGDMLVKVDRMSMAASLEVRCPMLDHKLAEFAATIPHEWKIRNKRGKDILIDALADRLPPELLHRPKMGFAVPIAEWFRGPLRPMLRDHLESPRFFARDIVSPSFVRGMIAEHESRRRNNTTWLWSLLVLEKWFRRQEASADASVGEPVCR